MTLHMNPQPRFPFSDALTLKTECFPDGRIEQSIRPNHSPFRELTKFVLDTRESDVRRSLIALGWTPPEEKRAPEPPPAPARPAPGAYAETLLGLTLAALREFARTAEETVADPDRNHPRRLAVVLASMGDYAQRTVDRVERQRRPDPSNPTT